MSFRGTFAIEGTLGSQVQSAGAVLGAPGTTDNDIAVPAGKTRWRVFGVWLSLAASLRANAAATTRITVEARALSSSGSQMLGNLRGDLFEENGGFVSIAVAGAGLSSGRGILLPDGDAMRARINAQLVFPDHNAEQKFGGGITVVWFALAE